MNENNLNESFETLVNGYGTSSDEASSKLIEKLKTHNAHHGK